MRGLLADVNVQGHLPYLHRLLVVLDLWEVLKAEKIELAAFPDVHLAQDLNDRAIWQFCQSEAWVLLTDNRNDEGEDSLQRTLDTAWRVGHLPVVTVSDKRRLIRDEDYALRLAAHVADVLYGAAQGEYRDQPRIFVPR
jgi:hypothetical protein